MLRAGRKDSRNSKPGLIIAKLNSIDDKKLVMKVKSKSFGNLYIENYILWEVRSQQNNIRMIPKEIGKSDKYKVIGTHIFPNQQKTSNWLDDSELLVDEQCGFWRNRRCLDHIYNLYSVINERKLSRLSTFSCFIDLEKAFDNVNRDCLWYKLQKYGINGKLSNAVKSLYDNSACTYK